MSVPTNPELDALVALTESEGWRLWLAWYEQEWGPMAMGVKVTSALAAVKTDAAGSAALIQQIAVAHEAVQGLKNYPTHRIAQLKRQTAVPMEGNLSRRGPGM